MPAGLSASRLGLALVAGLAVLSQSCGKNLSGDPLEQNSNNSVAVRSSPGLRSIQLQYHLNLFRDQTFSLPGAPYASNVVESDVLYTAAFRHATNINTANTVGSYSNTTVPSYIDNIDPANVTGGTTNTTTGGTSGANNQNDLLLKMATMEFQSTAKTPPQFPALFTDPDLFIRIEAVDGGASLVDGAVTVTPFEDYEFNGDIFQTTSTSGSGQSGGVVSAPATGASTTFPYFRGFNTDALTDANGAQYQFDAVDNMWYTRVGRTAIMRASTLAFAFAGTYDSNDYRPPYPILDNRFTGSFLSIGYSNLFARLGMWPNDGLQPNGTVEAGVTTYGLDTDVGGQNQYCGPPIHVTLPVFEPVLISPNSACLVSFTKMLNVDPRDNSLATVVATVSGGVVTNLNLATPGSGYSSASAPAVVITGGGATTNASGTAVVNADGTIGQVILTSGGAGYTSAPTVVLSRTQAPVDSSLIKTFAVYALDPNLSVGDPGDSSAPAGTYGYIPTGPAVQTVSNGLVTQVTVVSTAGAFSVITFDNSVNLSQVQQGDQVSLTVGEAQGYPFPNQYNGIYTVLWNTDANPPEAGIPVGLPPHSLAVNYINSNSGSPINVYYPNPVGTPIILPSFVSNPSLQDNHASVISTSGQRFGVVFDNERAHQLRSGEFFIVPTAPLEPNSWYEVGVRFRTVSYILSGATQNPNVVDTDLNPTLYKWTFKTNGRVPTIVY
jgi:hypothetical protein